jgi:hypothetical protein
VNRAIAALDGSASPVAMAKAGGLLYGIVFLIAFVCATGFRCGAALLMRRSGGTRTS